MVVVPYYVPPAGVLPGLVLVVQFAGDVAFGDPVLGSGLGLLFQPDLSLVVEGLSGPQGEPPQHPVLR